MGFTSPAFLPFVAIVVAACAIAGARRRSVILLAASYAFYATFRSPALLGLLAAVTGVSYGCALALDRPGPSRGRSVILWAGIAATVGLLGIARYGAAGQEGGSGASAFAAVGVSFFALQAIGYLVDVRQGVVAAERNLGIHALSLAFFPKLVQGPIERADTLLPQLREGRPISAADLRAGAELFVWGMFQKVAIADRLGPFVDAAYGPGGGRYEGVPLLVASYFFAAQLYFDFAGYTDMALGVARALGVRLTQNFDRPYLARSVPEFWRRWHVSFSSWLLDYVFRPLQLTLRDWRTFGTPVALVATFLLSGLWHGATWGFLAWGLLHGVFLATSALTRPLRSRLVRAARLQSSPWLAPLQVLVTFHLVCLAWVFFRSTTLHGALDLLSRLVTGLPVTLSRVARGEDLASLLFLDRGAGPFAAAVSLVVAGGALRAWFLPLERSLEVPEAPRALRSSWARTALYATMIYVVVVLGTAAQAFLYEQF